MVQYTTLIKLLYEQALCSLDTTQKNTYSGIITNVTDTEATIQDQEGNIHIMDVSSIVAINLKTIIEHDESNSKMGGKPHQKK